MFPMRFFSRNQSQIRKCSSLSANDNITATFVNRNPRNLERMTIGYKPQGYHLEKPGRCFWNKLILESTSRHVYAKIIHHTNGAVIEANTNEWAIKKNLYRTKDTTAYINLARVLAQRCHIFGITQLRSDIEAKEGGKVDAFLKTLASEGINLTEPEQFKPYRPWNIDRPPKPWEH